MCESGTSGFWQTEAVKTTSLCAVSSLAVVKPLQKKKENQKPGRISCSESAILISILARFAGLQEGHDGHDRAYASFQMQWPSGSILMNTADSTKIISLSACENSFLFRLTPLMFEIRCWCTNRPPWTHSQSIFSSQNDLIQIKIRQMHHTPYPLR